MTVNEQKTHFKNTMVGIYIYMCVCVCVCLFYFIIVTNNRRTRNLFEINQIKYI